MFEDIITHINELSPVWIYIILFLFSFIENVFPPSPSDIVVIFGSAVLAQYSYVHFVPILIVTGVGSAAGFILMYYLGKLLGEKIIRSGKLKFINSESVSKTDKWFTKYGYKLILVNRFLPGMRSVISFFSGLTELLVIRTFIFSLISALVWNAMIIFLGFLLGHNVQLIDYYLSTYSTIVLAATILVITGFIAKYLISKFRAKKN
jgi:membrane protein DedA with SNARE-associated domain